MMRWATRRAGFECVAFARETLNGLRVFRAVSCVGLVDQPWMSSRFLRRLLQTRG